MNRERVGLNMLQAIIESACHFVYVVKECHLRANSRNDGVSTKSRTDQLHTEMPANPSS
jgi:hypothetical protein